MTCSLVENRLYSHRATAWTVRCSNPGMDGAFYLLHNVQTCSGAHTASCSIRGSFSRLKHPGRKVHHRLPSGSRTKNKWSHSSPPSYTNAFMAWRETTCRYVCSCCLYLLVLVSMAVKHNNVLLNLITYSHTNSNHQHNGMEGTNEKNIY